MMNQARHIQRQALLAPSALSQLRRYGGNRLYTQGSKAAAKLELTSPLGSIGCSGPNGVSTSGKGTVSSYGGRRFLSSGTRGRGISHSRYKGVHSPDHLIVIGSGVAGCSTALVAAQKYSIPVTLLCAGSSMVDCNSFWAQGGIIYRNSDPSSGDSAESLIEDVFHAGAGLCDREAVSKLAHEGPGRVRELLLNENAGAGYANVPFDRDDDGDLSFCLEASHSAPRIIHFADHSGKAITDHITRAAHSHPLITVQTDTIVTDLITSYTDKGKMCLGVHAYHGPTGDHSSLFTARGVTLASGGLCGIYTHSTNPLGFNALGSSVALASRAGVACADLEYVQFHPTALNIPGEACFLLTEALRGEGAKLVTEDGYQFAKDFHPNGELAPRDVVARGVFDQMQQEGGSNVYLDISHRESDWLRRRFPTIHQRLLNDYGIDITKDKLPITPAAHYTCGGIQSDSRGRTTLSNLYVAGEAARTGLHGGNRLASTSLLEGLVWGASVADFVGDSSSSSSSLAAELHDCAWEALQVYDPRHDVHADAFLAASRSRSHGYQQSVGDAVESSVSHLLHKLRSIMWEHVGVVRTSSGLGTACDELHDIRSEAEDLYRNYPGVPTSQLRDASCAGLEVAQSAFANRTSQGAHCIVDDDDEESEGEDDMRVAAI